MANELRTRDGLPFNFVDGLRIKGVDVTNWDKVFIDQGASYVGFTPVGNLAASNVQAAIAELESEKQSKTEPITTAINLRPGANQGVVWDIDAFGGTQDTASITLETASGEASKMRFKMTNDSDDNFEFTAKSGDGLTAYNNAMSLNGNVLLNAANYADYAAPMISDYTALRAYTGSASQVRITSNGLAGFFYYDATDTTSADNGGTVIVASNGKRWKRVYDGAVSVKWFGAKGDWNGVAGTDDTVALQTAINFCRETSRKLIGKKEDNYKITSKLKTQTTATYAPVDIDFAGATIIVDFDSVDGFLVEGGSNRQTIKNFTIKPSPAYQQSGTYSSTAVGVRILNARVDITATAALFKGDGFLIESTASNSNTSIYDLYSSQCGRGFLVTGSYDDISVCQSKFRAFGSLREGIRVADTCAMRQWTGHWYSEGNWVSDTTNAANFSVYIGKATSCDFWIYCEQSGTASEIYASPTLTPYTTIVSARQNKDVITGTAVSVQGKDLTQVDYNVSSGLGRQSQPLRIVGKMARTGTAGEYVRVPFVGAADTVNGYVRGELLGIHLDSPNANNSISINDNYLSLGGPSNIAARRVYSGTQSISAATPSATVVLVAITASRSCAGRMSISGRSGAGAGQRIQIVDFSIAGTVLALAAPSVNVTPSVPPTIDLNITSGNLQLTLGYDSGQWGSTYNFSYTIDLTWA